MTTFRRQVLLRAFMLFDMVVMAVCFGLAALLVSRPADISSFAMFLSLRVKVGNMLLFLLFLVAWHLIFSVSGLYESRRIGNRWNEVKDVLQATLLGTFVIAAAARGFRIRMIPPVFLFVFWGVSGSITVASRLLLRSFLAWVRAHGRNLRHLVVVGTNARAVLFAQNVGEKPELGYRLVGFVDEEWAGSEAFRRTSYALVAGFDDFSEYLRERVVDEVVLALPMKSFYAQASRIVARCAEQGVRVRFLPHLFDLQCGPPKREVVDEAAPVTVYGSSVEGWPLVFKRALDVAISAATLVFLAPLFAVVAALIRCDSPGPIFFVQDRVGLNKRRFRIYKFRTMAAGAEERQAELEARNEAGGPAFKMRDDPRVTPIGKLLRRTSIDELPQLFNVLKGDMSLVGPRPLPVRDYQGFCQDWQRRRFSVRPGMTCLWQVSGRSSVLFDQWMDLDMEYIDHWSLWLDMKILAKTIPAVLKGTGAA